MKKLILGLLFSVCLPFLENAGRAAIAYVSLSGSHVPPFASWETAATNIQAAIDAAAANDTILVTNGVYATGRRVTADQSVSRVVINKPLVVESVNGPETTIIQGEPAQGENSPVRCIWATNGATIRGFTLRDGRTKTGTGSYAWGGGVYNSGSSNQVFLYNCIITRNEASTGGGVHNVTLERCVVQNNFARGISSSTGGGANNCVIRESFVMGNSAGFAGGGASNCKLFDTFLNGNSAQQGGGASGGTLTHCTLTENTASSSGGGASGSTLTNSIVIGNSSAPSVSNYTTCVMVYSCSMPLPGGLGNIAINPQLLGDLLHLTPQSPCRGAGMPLPNVRPDLDKQLRSSPPAMGCDEWAPEPAITASIKNIVSTRSPRIKLSAKDIIAGQPPFSLTWLKDGTEIAGGDALSLELSGPADNGVYELVATNEFGSISSKPFAIQIVCVDASSTNAQAPYSGWDTAAATIQDAIDVAPEWAYVLVTNGVYATGGRPVDSARTNRVAAIKPITLLSTGGPDNTIIQGHWDLVYSDNPRNVRCAWLHADASLIGFTLRDGSASQGGCVLGSPSSLVKECILTNGSAFWGAGAYGLTLERCLIVGNKGVASGGADVCTVSSSLITGNRGGSGGGGAGYSKLRHCTVINNYAGAGGGVYMGSAENCIIYGNTAANTAVLMGDTFRNCCTIPAPFKSVNTLTNDPMLFNGFLSAASPCLGAGNPAFAMGLDFDGEPWANPPSIGCDEFVPANLRGPISFSVPPSRQTTAGGLPLLSAQVLGRVSNIHWDFGDGTTAASSLSLTHTWKTPGTYTVNLWATNADYPAGVVTNITVEVAPFDPPQLSISNSGPTSIALSFAAQPDIEYNFQRATNLSSSPWKTFQTVWGGTGAPVAADYPDTNPPAFYRVSANLR